MNGLGINIVIADDNSLWGDSTGTEKSDKYYFVKRNKSVWVLF